MTVAVGKRVTPAMLERVVLLDGVVRYLAAGFSPFSEHIAHAKYKGENAELRTKVYGTETKRPFVLWTVWLPTNRGQGVAIDSGVVLVEELASLPSGLVRGLVWGRLRREAVAHHDNALREFRSKWPGNRRKGD